MQAGIIFIGCMLFILFTAWAGGPWDNPEGKA